MSMKLARRQGEAGKEKAMGWIVRQTEGKFADMAKEYHRIRLADGMAAAQAYYHKVAPFDARHIPPTSVWWLYNVDDAIKSPRGVTCREIERAVGKPFEEITQRRLAVETSRIATAKYGGKWELFPEY